MFLNLMDFLAQAGEKRNYRVLQLVLTIIMISVAIGPVLMTAALSYYYYSDLVQRQEATALEMRIDVKIKSVSAMVDDMASLIRFAARGEDPDQLIKEGQLEKLYMRISQEYPFIADIGVIDHSGIQKGYYGPFNLLGVDYSDSTWMKEVISQGDYISDVFMGNRQIPHFTIAVAELDSSRDKQWVLRANINASTLQKYINRIKSQDSSDLFLMNSEGQLQTNSSFFGGALDNYASKEIVSAIEHKAIALEDNFFIVARVPETPWSLVIINEIYTHDANWLKFRKKLTLIVLFCFVLSVALIYILVHSFTEKIKNSDAIQMSVLKESEHQDRLASIGRLAAGVGHEINNPLAIIDQKTGLIEDLMGMTDDFEYKEQMIGCLKSIGKSIDRCRAVTHRLLGFARHQESEVGEVDINATLKEVYEFLENALKYSRILVGFQLTEKLPSVMGDQIELQQVFLNIINNAIDAVEKDGNINISSQYVAGDVQVVIQDDGPGMDSNVVQHIFEPFFTTKKTGSGTGLGLSITYGLVKKMGGDIIVRSTEGVGTAFTIILPAKRE